MNSVRYIIVGGFLGAGKTTAVLRLARHLLQHGQRVGLITNDQSGDLVDTVRVRDGQFPVEEVAGGCFCCEFDTLVQRSDSLIRTSSPDVIVAEAVGSCTDLRATVAYPLRKLHGDRFVVAPLSVFADPHRLAASLGAWGTSGFSEKVEYIFRKQLEEADFIIVHKADLLSADEQSTLISSARRAYPSARVLLASSLTGEGTEEWYDAVLGGAVGLAPSMTVDYDTYAEGEALLGWFNSRGLIRQESTFDGNECLIRLTHRLSVRLRTMGVSIAHLKASLVPSTGNGLSVVSLTRSEDAPTCTQRLDYLMSSGEIIVNLRAEADPEILKQVVLCELDGIGPSVELRSVTAFRPSRPTPRHRMASALEQIDTE